MFTGKILVISESIKLTLRSSVHVFTTTELVMLSQYIQVYTQSTKQYIGH